MKRTSIWIAIAICIVIVFATPAAAATPSSQTAAHSTSTINAGATTVSSVPGATASTNIQAQPSASCPQNPAGGSGITPVKRYRAGVQNPARGTTLFLR
jgi:hypothetical protein